MKNKKMIGRILTVFSIFLFIGSSGFLIYYLGIQPYMSRQVQSKYKDIYYSDAYTYEQENSSEILENTTDNSGDNQAETTSIDISLGNYRAGAKNKDGILKKFLRLLSYNKDIKGWLKIDGTCIDYPVLQNNNIDYYLYRDFEGNEDKNGSLYIDEHSTIEEGCKNIVIHGHNMESTSMMFYELPNYSNIDYYKTHPTITFDTLYDESEWKIISFMRLYGDTDSNAGFNYMTGSFDSDSDFLDFLYQIELRSAYYCPVDVNENDSLLMLSTCSGTLNDGRAVLVARKVREGEESSVDTSASYYKSQVLYPAAWYSEYGGTSPIVTNFSDAYAFGEINWYDGEAVPESLIGSQIEDDSYIYEFTAVDQVKIIQCKDKNATELKLPETINYKNHDISITYAAAGVFKNMKKLERIIYNDSIATVPDRAFEGCKSLKYVTFGSHISSVGYKAFDSLESLKFVKFNTLNLAEIKNKAFRNVICKFFLPKEKLKEYRILINNSETKDSYSKQKFEGIELDM